MQVSGRVQGVWFRDTCRAEALRLGVHGWVRNRFDGRVEAVFEGHPDAVLTMVNWTQVGPRHAEVTGIAIEHEEPTGETGFTTR